MTPEERTALYGHWSTAELALKAVTKERDALGVQNDALREAAEACQLSGDIIDQELLLVLGNALSLTPPRAVEIAEARRKVCAVARQYAERERKCMMVFDGNISSVRKLLDADEELRKLESSKE